MKLDSEMCRMDITIKGDDQKKTGSMDRDALIAE